MIKLSELKLYQSSNGEDEENNITYSFLPGMVMTKYQSSKLFIVMKRMFNGI